MISRRSFVALLAFLLVPFRARAQQKVRRVGILLPGTAESEAWRADAFTQGLRELGYVEGKNVLIEKRFADGQLTRLSQLATELAASRVEVIFAGAVAATVAAKEHSASIPVVFMGIGDPVKLGLVASFARPGGLLTGLSPMTLDLAAKRLELLKEIAPQISRVAVLVPSEGNPVIRAQIPEIERAAKALRIEVLSVEFNGRREELDRVSSQIREWKADAFYAVVSATYIQNRALVGELAARNKMPSVAAASRIAEEGTLISYGIYAAADAKRAATYVDKILKGAKPADLPVEQAMQFELAINLKVAKALGITVPQSILMRADRVIK